MNSANDDTSTDFAVPSEADYVGLATVVIWAYLIPHFYIEYSEYRITLTNSPTWGRNPERLHEAKRALNRSFYFNIALGLCLYIGSSLLIGYLTDNLDRRAADIVTGSSRLFAGAMFLFLSINVLQWLGIYFSVQDTYKKKLPMFRSVKEIRVNFAFALWKLIASQFFFHLYFSCRTRSYSSAFGFLVGVAIGSFLITLVWILRDRYKKRKRCVGITIATFLSIVSVFMVLIGAYYIEDVWHEDYERGEYVYGTINYTGLVWGLWTIFVILIHLFAAYITKKRKADDRLQFRYTSEVFDNSMPGVKKLKESSGEEDNENDEIKEGVPTTAPQMSSMIADEDPAMQASDYKLHPSLVIREDSEMPQLRQGNTTKDFFIDNDEAPSFWYLFRVKMFETYGSCCGCCTCCYRDIQRNNNLTPNQRRMSAVTELKNSPGWKCFDRLKLFLWYFLSAFFLYLTIVNCGATQQQNVVRAHLNKAFDFLYPPDYQTGEMCGWDVPGPDADIRTFDTLQELYDANYTLIHCGACGECSTWNDLTLQWTTRTFLAEVSKKCAQKSLMGSVDDVQACNEDDIGFSPGCAECWTVDELCAKKNCFWIFLQSVVIDAVADYRVQLNDITSATCDEALCGPEFVPCSGATRRRMNIKSDIERPLYQQCTPQNANWTVIFDSP